MTDQRVFVHLPERKSEEIISILHSEDRRTAGKTANPEGLYLKNVFY